MTQDHIQNRTIDPETGYQESLAFPTAFTAAKKQTFLKLFYENGLRLRRTCDSIGLSIDTLNRALRTDPQFKRDYDELNERYLDELEGISRTNALNPRSVIERIFQLKCLKPEKYGQENRPVNTKIEINLDGKLLQQAIDRAKVINAEVIENEKERVPKISDKIDGKSVNPQVVDNQHIDGK